MNKMSQSSSKQEDALSVDEETERPAEDIVSKLSSVLLDNVKQEVGKGTFPTKTRFHVERVPLIPSNSEYCHENSPNCFADYIRSNNSHVILENMKATSNGILLNEMFTFLVKRVEDSVEFEKRAIERDNTVKYDEYDDLEIDEVALRRFVEIHSCRVAIIGHDEIGKSTVVRAMLQNILEGKLLPENQFIFYIPLRNVDYLREITLMKLLLTGCAHWQHSEESDKILLSSLVDNPNIVFIFEGLGEVHFPELLEPALPCDVYSKQTPGTFIAKILSGEVFINAKKVLTSEPMAFSRVHPIYQPRFVLGIAGLNQEEQQELCRSICGNDSAQVAMKYFIDYPYFVVSNMNQINCIITINVLNCILNQNEPISLMSLTDVYTRALEIFAETENMRGFADQMWKLSKIAWEAYLAKKEYFNETDCTNADISKACLEAFLSTSIGGEIGYKILEGEQTIKFSDTNWRELFVAIYLMLIYPLEEFQDVVKRDFLYSPQSAVLRKFLYGLCNVNVMEKAKTILCARVSQNWKNKKEVLCLFVSNWLELSGSNSEEFFTLCSAIREADDEKLNMMVSNHVPGTIEFSNIILQSDVVVATYVMRCGRKTIRRISFKDFSQITSTDFNYLCSQLALLPGKIECLDLLNYKVSDEDAVSLAQCLHKVKKVDFRLLTDTGLRAIADKLQECQLQSLRFHHPITGDTLSSFVKCVTSTERLSLPDASLSTDGAKTLASHLKHCKQLQSLSLAYNPIGDEGATAVIEGLADIENLDLSGCKISKVGCEAIASGRSKIKSLVLNQNFFGDEGLAVLSKCLARVDEIHLMYCDITSVGVEALARELQHVKIKTLNISNNYQIGFEGARAIAKCFGNITQLILNHCGINSPAVEAIASQLKNNKISKLCLSNNTFRDEGAAAIAKCLNNIDELDVSGVCCIASGGATAIASQLEQGKIKKLNLSRNAIGVDGAAAFAKCLGNVEELNLSECKLNSAGACAIARGLRHFQIKSLNLSFNHIGHEAVVALSECLPNIDELNLRCCNLHDVDVEVIANQLKKSRMRSLDISVNYLIGLSGAMAISDCLDRVEQLHLSLKELPQEGVEAIKKKLIELQKEELKVYSHGSILQFS